MSKIKKTIISFLAGIVLLLSIAPAVMAQGTPSTTTPTSPWYSQDFGSWWTKVYGNTSNPNEIFGERYTAAQVQWVIYGLFSFFMNPILNSVCSGDATALFTGSIGSFGKGCATSSVIPVPNQASLKGKNILSEVFADRTFSGVTYVKDLVRKFHVIPEAKAQTAGFGFSALDPVLPLWQAARNISYVLFVLVILILAFMIMFRVKISPQVVVSVQSALPKIAIGLVLVTFSYAIAGFLIDLMYVVIGLISIIFAGTNLLSSNNPVVLFGYLTTGFGNSGIFGFLILYFIQFLASFLVISLGIVWGVIGSFGTAGGPAGLALGTVVGGGILTVAILISIILFIAMFIILLWMSVKILITLIKAFAYILFLTILLPLQITFGVVVPSIGFGTWVRQFISNLAVFPITGALFLLSFIFMEQARVFSETNTPSFTTNLLAGTVTIQQHATAAFSPGWPPLLGISAGGVAIVFLIASFFIISLVPKAAEVASALITGKGNFGNAIGEAVGPVRSLGGAATGTQLSHYEVAARAAGMSVFEYVRTLPADEQARYFATAGLGRIFGAGGRR